MHHRTLLILLFMLAAASTPGQTKGLESFEISGSAGSKLLAKPMAEFDQPWAMTFLPDSSLLVTEKPGRLLLLSSDQRTKIVVGGVPEVAYGGQGGLGDVILHPDFASNQLIYLSYAESGPAGKRGAAVVRARLVRSPAGAKLDDLELIWRQEPKVSGSGHYSHRLAFSPDTHLFITSGDRKKQKPAQDWSQSLGKVIRLEADGSVPADNPFQNKGAMARTFWTIGHRNLLGIAFDEQGRLWTHEMGPRHGDELNLLVPGDNYGWPEVSWGNQYSGIPIPDHDTRPEFNPPEAYWVPSIAPSGLIFYRGIMFPDWHGNGLIGGLVSKSLIRIEIEEDGAREVERFAMGKRIREVEEGPDGAVWVLEDGTDGRLLRLTPPPETAMSGSPG
jgi:glucose/arabinose dehydrogenase